MKGHNYGLCRKCGKIHINPRGMLGKKNPNAPFKKDMIPWNKKPILTKYCELCSSVFFTKHEGQRFCSQKCAGTYNGFNNNRQEVRMCINCGNPFSVAPARKNKFCSKRCGLLFNHREYDDFGMSGHVQSEKCKVINSKVTRERNLENWKDPEYREKMEKMLREQSSYAASQAFKTLVKGKPFIYDDIHFMSKEEITCYKYLLSIGFTKDDVNYNYQVGNYYIDFFPKKIFFWEYHPCGWFCNPESEEEYYDKRRKILDNNGYEKIKLIHSTNVNYIKEDLICVLE